jgi:hypothetical protein
MSNQLFAAREDSFAFLQTLLRKREGRRHALRAETLRFIPPGKYLKFRALGNAESLAEYILIKLVTWEGLRFENKFVKL